MLNKIAFDADLSIENIEKLSFLYNKEKELNNDKKLNNFEKSNIQELNYIKIENSKKNDSNDINKIFEINKINDIYFEKDKKVKSFSQNLSMDNIFDFKIIQRIKRKNVFESENLFMETAEDFEYIIFKLINLEITEQIMLTFLKDKLNLSSNRTNYK